MWLALCHVLITRCGREEQRHTLVLGYSCVLFGWMALLAARQPGGLRMLPLLGLGSAPLWAAPWASLALTSLLVPRASFLGHLAGILAGYCLASGALDWLRPQGAGALLLAALAALAAQAARRGQLALPRLAGHLPVGGHDVEAATSSSGSTSGSGGVYIVDGQVLRR